MSRDRGKLRSGRNGLHGADDRETGFPAPSSKPDGWGSVITFRYSSMQIYAEGGDLHVKMRETRFQDGRLTSEECEGTLDRRAYERFVRDAQGYFVSQAGNFLKLLFAPFTSQTRHGRDD